MLEPQVIAYYATRSRYVFEPGIIVNPKDVDDYIKGIQKAGDQVLPLSLDKDFDAIRKAFFGPGYWAGRSSDDEYCEKRPNYAPPAFDGAMTPEWLSDAK